MRSILYQSPYVCLIATITLYLCWSWAVFGRASGDGAARRSEVERVASTKLSRLLDSHFTLQSVRGCTVNPYGHTAVEKKIRRSSAFYSSFATDLSPVVTRTGLALAMDAHACMGAVRRVVAFTIAGTSTAWQGSYITTLGTWQNKMLAAGRRRRRVIQ